MPGALSRVTLGDLTAENRPCSRERASPTLGAFRRVVPVMRITGGSLPDGRGPLLFGNRLRTRAALTVRRTSPLLGSLEGFLSSRARVFTRARAQPRLGRALHIAWGRCAGDPGSYDRRLQPTRFLFQRRVLESGFAPNRFAAHATRERGIHARARFGVPLHGTTAFLPFAHDAASL